MFPKFGCDKLLNSRDNLRNKNKAKEHEYGDRITAKKLKLYYQRKQTKLEKIVDIKLTFQNLVEDLTKF